MQDNPDTSRIVRDLAQVKMALWLLIALVAVVVAATTYLVVQVPALLQIQTGGTEPPIRVRGGSLHFELLAGGSAWQSASGGTEDTDWGLSPDYTFDDDIHMQIKSSVTSVDCPVLATVKKVTFTYTSADGSVTNEATIQATGNKTKVSARTKIKKYSDGSLVYDLDHHGYISAIKGVGGGPPVTCTFGPGELTDVILSPW